MKHTTFPLPVPSADGHAQRARVEPTPPSGRAELGRWGEDVAAEFVTDVGWTVLGRNWRCARGEIDLIALDGDILVFCEVKTRTSSACGSAVEAVHPQKVARLRALCGQWLQDHAAEFHGWAEIRLDVIAVSVHGGVVTVEHVAWVG